MEKSIQGLLKKLTAFLEINRLPILNFLKAGKASSDIRKLIEPLKIDLPNDIYELYNWKNGTDEKKSRQFFSIWNYTKTWLFPYGKLCSIEEAILLYNFFAGKDLYWKDSMFPLFEAGGGDYILYDFDNGSPTYRMLYLYSVPNLNFEVVITAYDDLESLLKTVIECFEKKVFYYGSDYSLNSTSNLEPLISKYHNPKSQFWNL